MLLKFQLIVQKVLMIARQFKHLKVIRVITTANESPDFWNSADLLSHFTEDDTLQTPLEEETK